MGDEALGPRVVSAGWGDHGRLGLRDETRRLAFTCIDDLLELDVTPHEVAVGERHSVVLSTRGAVYTFGDGDHGQLGLGAGVFHDGVAAVDERRRLLPCAVNCKELGYVAHVTASYTSTFAITGKGQVGRT